MAMRNIDIRIDNYIDLSADFAKPILITIRDIVHKACPKVTETMKWSFPHFEYNGSILCSMASFKHHCAFGFWLGGKMKDPYKVMSPVGEKSGMGHFGQIKSVKDLPSKKILTEYIKEAMALIDQGEKLKQKKSAEPKKEIKVPDYFLAALKKNKKALTAFNAFSYSHKKEYVEWITEAKTEATREKRIATAIEWLGEGKARNWKYMK
jgi:uncharacterized protein YdeI (YjbR/CyaY-like superfamily)